MTKSLTHLIAACVFLALSLAAFSVWYMTVENARAAVGKATEDIALKTTEAKRIQDARGALTALSHNEERIKGYFVAKEEIGSFLETISATGDSLGSDVEIVSVNEEPAGEGRARVSVALSVTGSFDAVMRTIGALEYGPYDVLVKNLSLNSEEESGWNAVAIYSFGAQTP